MAFGLDVILLFGDSLTQGGWEAGGFAQRLAHVYARKLDVINRGLSGYNSEWALPVFEKVFPKRGDPGPKVRLLTLWLGGNDSCLEPSPQYLPLGRFIANLTKMVRMVQDPDSPYHSPETRIVLITPPPVSEKVRGADLASRNPPIALDRSASNTKRYAEAVTELAKNLSLPVVDLYTPIASAAGDDEDRLKTYLSDGLHLTPEGYTVRIPPLLYLLSKSVMDYHAF